MRKIFIWTFLMHQVNARGGGGGGGSSSVSAGPDTDIPEDFVFFVEPTWPPKEDIDETYLGLFEEAGLFLIELLAYVLFLLLITSCYGKFQDNKF